MHYIEWLACASGIVGALMIALKTKNAKWGFALFLLSNFCWMAFAVQSHAYGLLVMQLGYMAINLIGIKQWFKS